MEFMKPEFRSFLWDAARNGRIVINAGAIMEDQPRPGLINVVPTIGFGFLGLVVATVHHHRVTRQGNLTLSQFLRTHQRPAAQFAMTQSTDRDFSTAVLPVLPMDKN